MHLLQALSWEIRREALKTLGILGALDPFEHRKIQMRAVEMATKRLADKKASSTHPHSPTSPHVHAFPQTSSRSVKNVSHTRHHDSTSPAEKITLLTPLRPVNTSVRALNTYVTGVKHYAMATVDDDMLRSDEREFRV